MKLLLTIFLAFVAASLTLSWMALIITFTLKHPYLVSAFLLTGLGVGAYNSRGMLR